MKTDYKVRLSSDEDIKTIEALEKIKAAGDFKSDNKMIIRCIEKGLPLLAAEVFGTAKSNLGKEVDFTRILRLIEGLERDVSALIVYSEIQERLISFNYNSHKKQQNNLSELDEMKMCNLPECYAKAKLKAMDGFINDED